MNIEKNKFKVTFGPSFITPVRAVMIDYDKSIFDGNFSISSDELKKINKLLPNLNYEKFSFSEIENVHKLLPMLVNALQDIGNSVETNAGVIELDEGKFILYAEYHFIRRSTSALNVAILIIKAIKSPLELPAPQLVSQIRNFINLINSMSIGNIVHGFLMKAKKRNIPVYLLLNENVYNSFGQGKNSKILYSSYSEYDSFIGSNLQNNKAMTNEILINIGYPTSEQVMVKSIEHCHQNVNRMGFPVVVKPLNDAKGRGVTANIQTLSQLNEAFIEAEKLSAKKVLLEKHVVGDVHRITVSQGNVLAFAIRYPAQIIGDGLSNISTLIEKENKRRREPESAALKIKQIAYDDRVKRNLNNAGYTMENIPTIGEKVLLSDIANRSVGGTLEMLNVNDMHPDYIEMSGDICRTFRLGSVGIDVISSDISKSWREVGVIIEINCNPMAAPELADKILESHFGNNEGRIDTTLVISDDDKMARNIFNKMKKTFEKPGFASVDIAEFASGPLITKNEGLAHRCLSLVLNKGCDAVVVSITPEEIMENGLPLDYFDHCVIDAKSNINNEMVKKSLTLSTKFDKLENWLKQYVGHINN